ncbi:MAG: Tryptophan--tRNA ligase [Candidatus Methanogaster sp.]|nr:MAG: Tryptophan--tRNA ligase [ANME-2 cluster archaeon]
MSPHLDPWASAGIDDYSKLFEEFGIQSFDELLPHVPDPCPFIRRRIIFGHRGYEPVLDAIIHKKPFAVMSGFMPSGRNHLGNKMVMEEIIWHQRMGGDAFVGIADMEAHSVRGMSWKDCRRIGVEDYVLSLIALGFEPDGHIYYQSECSDVRDLAFELGMKTNVSELSAIYGFSGETNIAHLQSALVQSADILQPQIGRYGGPKPVVIPVGADQDPHIRLVRGLASKMRMFRCEIRSVHEVQHHTSVKSAKGMRISRHEVYESTGQYISVRGKSAPKAALSSVASAISGMGYDVKQHEEHLDIFVDGGDDKVITGSVDARLFEAIESVVQRTEIAFGGYGFMPPAATYHRFMSGLQGGKMSSSVPESIIALTEPPEDASAKVKNAKTGGRMTLGEQKRLGGEPDRCTAYELLLFHLIPDDKEIVEIYHECKSGKRMCGPCKAYAGELLAEFLRGHQEGREIARERLGEYGLT